MSVVMFVCGADKNKLALLQKGSASVYGMNNTWCLHEKNLIEFVGMNYFTLG